MVGEQKMFVRRNSNPFDEWAFWIFKLVLFIIFLYSAYQFLDSHVPVST